MKKKLYIFASCMLMIALLCGCVGTPVVVGGDCTCDDKNDQPYVPKEGEVKVGLSVLTDVSAADGKITYNVMMAAVAVDAQGVITDCVIDGISADVTIGDVTEGWKQSVQTKNELGDKYGMVAWGNARYEWYQQAENFANYVKGKTAEQVSGIAVTESGKPADSDLATSVTITIGDFVQVVKTAANNAKYVADAADTLVLAATPALSGGDGNVQLDMDVTALSKKDGVITGCYIDAVQAKVAFDGDGNVTTDLTAGFQTKNELGDKYGMVAWGNARYEWYQQAENFANYVKGKTAEEIAGIAITESGKPSDADLGASVTIAIGGFQALIQKAMQ